MKIDILEKKYVKMIGDADIPVNYYYAPVISSLYLKRLKMALGLMGKDRYETLLEIGYGTGIFMPELAKRAEKLYGIDVKDNVKKVTEILKINGINAVLSAGDILSMPYEDGMFDCVLCISVMEHIKDLDTAMKEISRVLKKGGTAVFGFPSKNPYINVFFKLSGFDPDVIHPSSHKKIREYIDKYFAVESEARFQPVLPLYYACKCVKK